MRACRSCGADVRLVRTAGGKTMPIDATPVPDGNVVLRRGIATVTTSPPPGEDTYVSHFTTCPNANDHRRTR